LKKEQIGIGFRERKKIACREWAMLSKDQRKVFHINAKLAKQRYVQKFNGFRLPGIRGGCGRSMKDPTKPERCDTPYKAF